MIGPIHFNDKIDFRKKKVNDIIPYNILTKNFSPGLPCSYMLPHHLLGQCWVLPVLTCKIFQQMIPVRRCRFIITHGKDLSSLLTCPSFFSVLTTPLPCGGAGGGSRAEGGFYLNLFIQSIYASTEAVTISVFAPKP